MIRNKKFRRYLIARCYPIAIDGTQKLVRDGPWWSEYGLERRRETSEGESVQQYVYVLEANRVFHNGVTLPGLGEFLSDATGDPDDHKRDGELKAFHRWAARLKDSFPRLPILRRLDGLYPNGPLMALCHPYHGQFMIVLPNKRLPSVWEKVHALKPPQAQHRQSWRGRQQPFWWVNDITYRYDPDRKSLRVHVIGCDERWQEVDPDRGELVDHQTQPIGLSSQRLNSRNVHERCNLGARQRWGIETRLQIEKRRGYGYEHAFSHDWNAMQGYHYRMRLAHLLNALALATRRVMRQVQTLGRQAFLRWVRESCAHRWLRPAWLAQLRRQPPQLRLE